MNVMYKNVVFKRNITDVSFMILNMKRAASTISQLTSRVSFPVYQEPVSQDIMGMLGGAKDDILIYDRCGLLVKHFSMPYSYLGWPFVRNSLWEVINNPSKCKQYCPVTTTASTKKSSPSTSVISTLNKTTVNPSSLSSSESGKSEVESHSSTASSPVTKQEGLNNSSDRGQK
mmetsp:Transcript_50351/g.80474  ORF Transcript_50351/g.80474 Transcript_50351/m.80474 type:complete len:173 (+) Transcript_50351:300-818(+)